MLDPNLIDPGVFAAEGRRLQGRLALNQLDERVWSHEYLANKEAEVSFTLQGGRDRWQRLYLDLSVKGDVPLVCQRCIKPMPFASLDEAMLSDDELEGMLLQKALDVRMLVEDQILMALPFSPRHEDCGNAALAEVNQDKPNPFAVLAGLKSSR
jgi:uncharacterized protein